MSYIAPMTQSGGGTLYICPDMTNEDVASLKADLARVYSNSSNGGSRKRKAPEPATAITKDIGTESSSQSGSDREESDYNPQQPKQYGSIAVHVSDGSSYMVSFPSAAQGMTAADLKHTSSTNANVPAAQLRLVAVQYGVSNVRKPIDDTTMLRDGSIVRLLLPKDRVLKIPRHYQVLIQTLTGKNST